MTLEEKLHLLREHFYDHTIMVTPLKNWNRITCQVINEYDGVAISGYGISVEEAVNNALEATREYFKKNQLDYFESLAAWFYRDTGTMAPGKDSPAAMSYADDDETRAKQWNHWIDKLTHKGIKLVT